MKQLYFKSVKPFAAEEPSSYFFMRPIGFIIALAAKVCRISPNMLTFVKGAFGVWAGVLFVSGTADSIFLGAIILFIANIFDSSDGQLARILDKSSRFGVIIDCIGDWVLMAAVYLGSALALFLLYPESGFYWWLISGSAFISFLLHVYVEQFTKYELFMYMSATESRGISDVRISADDLNKESDSDAGKRKNIFFKLIIGLNRVVELVSRIVLIKRYKGFFEWYKKDNSVPAEKKEQFRAKYPENFSWIVVLFNNLGMLSNQLIFIICGLFNRLDLALYIILFGSNAYFLILVLVQRLAFSIQMDNLGLEPEAIPGIKETDE